jgi:hypothetical protein
MMAEVYCQMSFSVLQIGLNAAYYVVYKIQHPGNFCHACAGHRPGGLLRHSETGGSFIGE